MLGRVEPQTPEKYHNILDTNHDETLTIMLFVQLESIIDRI